MTRGLYVVRDVKAGDVGDQVMVCKADAVAIRAFTDALSNAQNFMSKYPEDYELLCIGEMFEDGTIVGDHVGDGPIPRTVITGTQWKAAKEAAN